MPSIDTGWSYQVRSIRPCRRNSVSGDRLPRRR